MRMRNALVIGGVAAMLFASCAKESKQTTAAPPTVSVNASNYKFAAPETVPAGVVSMKLSNAGPEVHQAQLLRLNDGANAQQVVTAAKDPTELGIHKLGTYAGGPNAVDKGESQAVTMNLSPGRYVFMCLVPDAKGRPHASLGMVKAFTVTSGTNDASEPPAGLSASAREFDFQLPSTWTGTVKYTNLGKQDHEFQIMEVAPGRTPADFENFFKSSTPETGPPPWTTQGGLAVVAPGKSGTFTVDLKPGTYYVMCFVTDPQRKAPHFALGMMKKFTVK